MVVNYQKPDHFLSEPLTVYKDGKRWRKSINILISRFIKQDFANLGHNGPCVIDASIL